MSLPVKSALQGLLFLLAAGLSGCMNSRERPRDNYAYDDKKPIEPQFKSIRVVDGIDVREADILSCLYFWKYEGYCGASFPVQKRGKKWHADTVVGPNGAAQSDIIIHSETGVITHRGAPDSAPPWNDLGDFARMISQFNN